MPPWCLRLLEWYYHARREMPWRGHPDAYAVWVSEIMLQQTQVNTVRPYFERFLQLFPDVFALASATDEALLKEAKRLINASKHPKKHRLSAYGIVWAITGAVCTGIIWLITALV